MDSRVLGSDISTQFSKHLCIFPEIGFFVRDKFQSSHFKNSKRELKYKVLSSNLGVPFAFRFHSHWESRVMWLKLKFGNEIMSSGHQQTMRAIAEQSSNKTHTHTHAKNSTKYLLFIARNVKNFCAFPSKMLWYWMCYVCAIRIYMYAICMGGRRTARAKTKVVIKLSDWTHTHTQMHTTYVSTHCRDTPS